jgi:hypothetical protein
MTSQTKPESTSDETAPEENTPRRFRASRFHRWGNVSLTVAFFLLWVLELTGGGEVEGWWGTALDGAVIGSLTVASIAGFQRGVLVGKEEIREARPLWEDQSVQTSEIRRIHVPTTQEGLWLYTDPDGEVALTIRGGLEAPDELEELVIGQAPSDVEVTGLGRQGKLGRQGNGSS